MNRPDALLEQRRTTGHRPTPQRAMVLSVLAESRDHLSVDEVYQNHQQVYPFVDLATVYRTLLLLTNLHIPTAIEETTEMRYELVRADDRHHHMGYEECGGAFDLPPHYLEVLREQLV